LPSANDKSHTRGYYSGELLLAIGSRQFDQPSRLAAKYLCRQALSPLLGNKPLKSRELFQ
jgi:DNA repair protein RecO (recombination protein O)